MNMTLRGCDEKLAKVLKSSSKKLGLSVNRLILDTLAEVFLGQGRTTRRHDDLDQLAGTWSAEEATAFDEAVSDFGKLDEALWSMEKP